jgi:hypothetical protein
MIAGENARGLTTICGGICAKFDAVDGMGGGIVGVAFLAALVVGPGIARCKGNAETETLYSSLTAH